MKIELNVTEIVDNGIGATTLGMLEVLLNRVEYTIVPYSKITSYETQVHNLEKEVADLKKKLEDANSVTEKPVEAPKKEKPTPTKAEPKKEPESAPTQEVTKEVTKPKEEPKSSITLDVLKESAKSAVMRTDREKVKATIGEYGIKLTDVAEADYGKLYKKLQELGK